MYLSMQRQVCVLLVRRQKPKRWHPSRSVRTKVKCCTATPSLTLNRRMGEAVRHGQMETVRPQIWLGENTVMTNQLIYTHLCMSYGKQNLDNVWQDSFSGREKYLCKKKLLCSFWCDNKFINVSMSRRHERLPHHWSPLETETVHLDL